MANCGDMGLTPILGIVLWLAQPAADGRGEAVQGYLRGRPPSGTPVSGREYNQGPPARLMVRDGGGELWLRKIGEQQWVAALLNSGDRPVSLNVVFRALGLPYRLEVRDLWPPAKWGEVEAGFAQRVEPGDARIFLLDRRR